MAVDEMSFIKTDSDNTEKSHDEISHIDTKNSKLAATTAKSAVTTTQKIPQEVINLLAGGFSGMVAKSLVAPIDRIKILYQVTNVQFHLTKVPNVAYKIIQEEGLSALWKGNTATMLRVFPYSGLQFMTYDIAKHYILKKKHPNSGNVDVGNGSKGMTPFENLCAGMFAGTVSVMCTYPLDLTRAQLAVLVTNKNKNATGQSIRSVFVTNFNERGLSGLFRGIAPTLLGIMPYSGLAFTINEQSKAKIRDRRKREPTNMEKLQCGALSGLFAQSITYPLEVTRRRMQTHGLISEQIVENLLDPTNKQNSNAKHLLSQVSMKDIIIRLYKEEGIAGFFKGVSMNWVKGPIAISVSFTTYDIMKDLLTL